MFCEALSKSPKPAPTAHFWGRGTSLLSQGFLSSDLISNYNRLFNFYILKFYNFFRQLTDVVRSEASIQHRHSHEGERLLLLKYMVIPYLMQWISAFAGISCLAFYYIIYRETFYKLLININIYLIFLFLLVIY